MTTNKKERFVSTSTLTSLALLKVNIDHDSDYLDYLRPFVIHVLAHKNPEKITDQAVTSYIREQFGLEIPQRTIQVVLKRLARQYHIRRVDGVYHLEANLPDSGLTKKTQTAERHTKAVVYDLIEFSKSYPAPLGDPRHAMNAICAFLAKFDIICLRAYLRGTAIPNLVGSHDMEIVLVSKFLLHIQHRYPERFESFMIVVQGHMLANALLCPDLRHATKTYKGVAFYLDTPLLVRSLGLEGTAKQDSTMELIRLLRSLGGEVATLFHSRNELEAVIQGAASKIDARDGRGAIVAEARRQGTTKSDLLLLAGKVDDELKQRYIKIRRTPPYIPNFQIDENAFGQVLDDEVSYFNERARDYDVNSVRSIYVLRRGKPSSSVEKSRAILVTSNSAFARAAWNYGREHESSKDVSSVITDFSLANVAWLKAPMGAPSLPEAETMAFSYAALQPSSELLNKFMLEVDKLERQGRMSARDHQILRSDIRVQDELMELTLGDEEALTEERISETLERISAEIRFEDLRKLETEKEAHSRTRADRDRIHDQSERIMQSLYWKCHRRAGVLADTMRALVFALLILGIVGGLGIQANNAIVGWTITSGSAVLALCTLGNLMFGTTVEYWHERFRAWCLRWLLKREAELSGVNLARWGHPE